MPRAPELAAATRAMPGAVFSPVGAAGSVPEGVCPLHVGDTWLEPPVGARAEDLRAAELEGLHRYGDTRGLAPLREALAARLRTRNGLPAEAATVLVTAGATGALATALGAIANPGDEVLILAPYWPLIRGITQALRAAPVEVPFYDRVNSADEAVAAVAARASARSVALYVSSPSNPTGRVLPGEWLEALAGWARREGLWLLSDEVYEELLYTGEHVSPGRFAPECSFSAFSFSKAWAMAGNRVGYLTGPAEALAGAAKIATHTFYHAPTAGQWAALRALESGAEWLADARRRYAEVGRAVSARLGLPAPEGGTFLFVDVAQALDARGLSGFLADCLEDGFALAPGGSCGADYASWVRLCFTSAPPEAVMSAVEKLAGRLGR